MDKLKSVVQILLSPQIRNACIAPFVYRFLVLSYSTKKKKMADKILPQRVIIIYRKPFSAIHSYTYQSYLSTATCSTHSSEMSLSQRKWIYKLFSYTQIRELVPESQAYMDLLAFERKLDQTIMRKRLDIQEALKRPIKVCFPSVSIDVLDDDLQVGICCNADIVTVSYMKLFLPFLVATRHQV